MASPLIDLARIFLRLGLTSFGGPAAHTAFMREELVRQRQWLTDAEFLDLVAAANLIPGPNSTELAMHIGRRRAGPAGLIVAGACFIVPAFVAVLGVAVAYRRYGSTPDASWLMAGVAPVVLGIIAHALAGLASATVRSVPALLVAAAAVTASLLGVHELMVLAAGGLIMIAWRARTPASTAPVLALGLAAVPAGASAAVATAATAAVPVGLTALTVFFLKVGSVLFGSGYVLLAFLRADLVDRWGWLTPSQLLDAIAVGQFTPGPLFTTATFIGYVLAGLPGAVLATVGIFLPGFVFVALTAPVVDRLRTSRLLSALLDGVVLASLGLMAAVTVRFGLGTLTTWPRAVLALAALVVLAWRRPNTAWLVLAGGILGWATGGLGAGLE